MGLIRKMKLKVLLEIIANVTSGALPRDSAIQIISIAFNLTTEKADQVLGEVGRGPKPDAVEGEENV